MVFLRRSLLQLQNVAKLRSVGLRAQSTGIVAVPLHSAPAKNRLDPEFINQVCRADIHKCLSSNIEESAAGLEPVSFYYFDGQVNVPTVQSLVATQGPAILFISVLQSALNCLDKLQPLHSIPLLHNFAFN